jgi:hypothetical protein
MVQIFWNGGVSNSVGTRGATMPYVFRDCHVVTAMLINLCQGRTAGVHCTYLYPICLKINANLESTTQTKVRYKLTKLPLVFYENDLHRLNKHGHILPPSQNRTNHANQCEI